MMACLVNKVAAKYTQQGVYDVFLHFAYQVHDMNCMLTWLQMSLVRHSIRSSCTALYVSWSLSVELVTAFRDTCSICMQDNKVKWQLH